MIHPYSASPFVQQPHGKQFVHFFTHFFYSFHFFSLTQSSNLSCDALNNTILNSFTCFLSIVRFFPLPCERIHLNKQCFYSPVFFFYFPRFLYCRCDGITSVPLLVPLTGWLPFPLPSQVNQLYSISTRACISSQ